MTDTAVETGSNVLVVSKNFETFVHTLSPNIERVLPKSYPVSRVEQQVMLAAGKNRDILQCTKQSIAQSIMTAVTLGLDIGIDIHLVPLKESRQRADGQGKETVLICNAWPDYKGMVRMARAAGIVRDMIPYPVYANDFYESEQGTAGFVKHKPAAKKDRGKLVRFYVLIEMPYGRTKFHEMWFEDVEERRSKSRAWKNKSIEESYPWYGCKTVIRDWLNRQPKLGAKLEHALVLDAQVEVLPDVTADGELRKALPAGSFNEAGPPASIPAQQKAAGEEDDGAIDREIAARDKQREAEGRRVQQGDAFEPSGVEISSDDPPLAKSEFA